MLRLATGLLTGLLRGLVLSLSLTVGPLTAELRGESFVFQTRTADGYDLKMVDGSGRAD